MRYPREATKPTVRCAFAHFRSPTKDLVAQIRNADCRTRILSACCEQREVPFIYDRLIISWVNDHRATPEQAAGVIIPG
jgi:hypothetical protein